MNQILTLHLTGDSLLRQHAATIADPSGQELKALVDAMLVTMRAFNGVGIAAPQIGHSLRVVIVASQPNSRYPDAPIMEPLVMVNPAIITKSPEMRPDWEGCLSVPGQRLQVLRHLTVEACWDDLDAHRHQQFFSGFVARIIQHELDHLDGILFTDRAAQTVGDTCSPPFRQ